MDFQFFASSTEANKYDFGWKENKQAVREVLATLPEPFFAQAAPNLMNLADEKKDGILYTLHKRIFGKHLTAQSQPRGTCFKAGTQIRLANGKLKAIENVKVGDKVLSHRNISRKVIETKSISFTGDMYSIHVDGYNQPLTATDKHLVLTRTEDSEDFVWKEMHEITKEDYLVIPKLHDTSDNDYETLDVTDYLRDVRYKIFQEDEGDEILLHYAKQNKRVKRYIKVDEDFAELIGLYLAEGSSTVPSDRNYPDRVVFTYNLADEEYLADRTVELLKKVFNVDSYIIKEPKHSTIRVRCNYCTLGQFLISFCGKGSLTKRVPGIFFNSKPSVKLKLINNWIVGDGSKQGKDSNTATTSSFEMYKDFYQLSISCGIVPKYYQSKQESHQNAPANRLYYTQDHTSLQLKTRSETHLDTDIGICLKVKNIVIQQVESETVYDIGVEEDHSFIAEGYAVHNCVSRGWSRLCDYTQLAQIVSGQPLEFKMASHSFIYGASRVIGNWMSYEDGSVGAWAAKAVQSWGVCTREEVGDVPAGNDSLAVEWAAKGVPQKYKDLAKDNLVKKVTMVRTAEEAKAALINLFGIAVCSNRGFTTTRDSKGRCTPSGTWNHCYGAGTKISTPNGIVNIEDLHKGDNVYTSEGNIQHVTHNFERNYTGKIYTIKPKHAFEFTCTEEHPILVYTSQTEGLNLNSETYGVQTITWTKKKLVWKKAKDIVLGDLVISPTVKQHKFTEQPIYKTTKNHKNIPYILDTKDKDTSWLFGLFAGDGNVVKNHKVTFTLSNKKQITKLANIIRNKIGLTPSIQEKQTYSRITVYSSILAEYFREAFYNSKKEKIVPTFQMDNTSFIEGLKDADGTQCRDFVEIYNTSKDLLLGIQQMAIELGYTPKIAPRKSYNGCYPNAKQGYYITFGNNNKFVEKIDGNVCYPIDEIIVKHVEDMKVYNLEVNEEHTYIAEGLATHNCMLISGYDDELRRFLIEQSWGQNNPSGPLYKDQPDNSFWADWDVVDGMLRQEDSFLACDMDAWMLRDISWYL